MALAAAAFLFAVYAANVVMGAVAQAQFLSDVTEMLILFGTSIFFVAAVLKREAQAGADPSTDD